MYQSRHNIPPEEQTVGAAVRVVRGFAHIGVRELSRRSGVAAPQISRLERGEVKKPTIETLVALARGLDRNPLPLLIVAGYVETDEARSCLRAYHLPGAEYLEEASADPASDLEVAAIRAGIDDENTPLERLQQIAFDVWCGGESGERLWDDVYAALPALGEGQVELREIVSKWPFISFERSARIVEYVRDQYQLSIAEMYAETKGADAAFSALAPEVQAQILAAASEAGGIAEQDELEGE
jgi:transcriptional regulator with XRE-family HTH domain